MIEPSPSELTRTEKQRKRALAKRPAPSEKEAAKLEPAKERLKAARDARLSSVPRTKVRFAGPRAVEVSSPHTDDVGWSAQMSDALATCDGRVASFLQMTASSGAPTQDIQSQTDANRYGEEVEEILAFAAENAPNNPVETALLIQMAACHRASMTMVRGVQTAPRRDQQADSVRLMNQTMRTFAAQAEALHKLRTGGKQQVEVRYVYVDARTQTVVNGGSGDGGGAPKSQQPHAPALLAGPPVAGGLPVWGADAGGDAVPIACDPGQAPLPDARRQESGSTEG